MITLFGRSWTRDEIRAAVGDLSQIAGARLYRLAEGFEEGTLAADVYTGSGLEFTVLPSRGMDVTRASFRGIPLAWTSAQTSRHPAYYEPEGLGWLRSFPGGLMTTCGLSWMGAPDEDGGQPLGLHGRISNTPATAVRASADWEREDYVISVEGCLREAVVFGENLLMKRRIRTTLGSCSFTVEDEVVNEGFERAPLMLLYHCNVGFPVVADGALVVVPARETCPRDAEAADGLESWSRLHGPKPGYREKVYFHTVEPGPDGTATAAVVNPTLGSGLAVFVRYRPEQLPCFVQWKMLGAGTYVVGLEPGNALVLGRSKEREAGRLQTLEPGEERRFTLEIGVLEGDAALAMAGDRR